MCVKVAGIKWGGVGGHKLFVAHLEIRKKYLVRLGGGGRKNFVH